MIENLPTLIGCFVVLRITLAAVRSADKLFEKKNHQPPRS